MTVNVVFGCGFIGSRIAADLRALKRGVVSLVRTETSRNSLEEGGFDCLQVDLDQRFVTPLFENSIDTLFYLVPPPGSGVLDTRSTNAQNLISANRVEHIVLVSATGVYGDCGGEWIDESRPVNPLADRSIRRVDAECQWSDWAVNRGVSLTILRVSGIYSSDRLPEKRIRAQTPVLAEAISPFSNRIHADDLVSLCTAAADVRYDGVINVADDEPTTMTDYFFRVADALKLPRPPEISLAEAEQRFSGGMMSYLRESRRIDNTRLKRELGMTLRFPTLAEGLRDV